MNTTPIAIPKIAIQSIAGGLLLMALFTAMWSGIASGNLEGGYRMADMAAFLGSAVVFIGFAVYFFRSAARFQTVLTDEERTEGKKMGKSFGIIFGLEGVLIPIAAGICAALHQPALILPAIALVVALHFYPMAKIFQRTIDYYLATWTTFISVIAIIMTLKHAQLPIPVLAFLGIGMALATSCYGFYMVRAGRQYLKN